LFSLIVVLILSQPMLLDAQTSWHSYYSIRNDTAFGKGVYVSAGDTLLYSTNSLAWYEANAPTVGGAWTGVAFGNDHFVAVNRIVSKNRSGLIAFSTNGVDWVKAADPQKQIASGYFQTVRFLNGSFWALSDKILNSDSGVTWNLLAQVGNNETFRDIAFGAGRFVAVGTKGSVAISTNSTRWSLETPFRGNNLQSIYFSNSKFYLVDVYSDYYSSADGHAWKKVGSFAPQFFGVSFAESSNSLFTVGGTNIYRSNIPEVWTGLSWHAPYFLNSIRVLNDRYFVSGAGNMLFASTDLTNWDALLPVSPSKNDFFGIAANETNEVAVGAAGTILLKEGTESWRIVSSPTPASFKSAVHFDDRFFAAGSNGAIISSTDGEHWQSEESGVGNDPLVRVTVANGHLLAMGWGGDLLERDSAGHWNKTIVDTNLSLNCIAYGNGLYVAGGERIASGNGGGGSTGALGISSVPSLDDVPTIYTSTDLKNWLPGPSKFRGFQGAAFGNGLFVLTGSFGQIARSEDGTNWISTDSGVEVFLEDCIFANGKFYAAGLIGELLVSEDGISWFTIPCSTSMVVYRLCATSNSLSGVGQYGTIIEAPFDLYFKKPKVQRGGLEQTLYGAQPAPLKIESSSDLKSWTNFMEVESPSNPFTFSSEESSNRLFLRAVQ
jgi:hypothetical protein